MPDPTPTPLPTPSPAATPSPAGSADHPVAVRVPKALRLAAAARLVGGSGPSQARAAKNLIDAAPRHGIDLNLFFACRVGETLGPVCLAVPGSGKTAVLFMSSPVLEPEPEIEGARRGAAVLAATEHLEAAGLGIRLIQALPSPGEIWAVEALEAGGLTEIATLTYLRRAFVPGDKKREPVVWPEGITVGPVGPLSGSGDSDPAGLIELVRTLDATYEQTLDCPELCGLRETADVVQSHKASGQFDAALWRLVRKDGEPVGCCLLNRNPDLGSVELVYVGLAPSVRGLGLGRLLLEDGIARAARLSPEAEMTCAVDARNTPAVRMYERAGFESFATKLAYLRGLGGAGEPERGIDPTARKV
ncbi:MAG: ribosomal protein S18 acetylase RimI-like enzyme [Phycisphaerales bacterium]|jgi:ribosomal protein S18 acetylase RimI-like enzyme